MRQRKIKDIEKKIEAFSEPLVYLPASNRGRWREVFGAGGADGEDAFAASGAGRPLFLEIGCGKGRFISDSALGHPEFLYLGFEGHQSVLYRALQRVYAGPDAKPTELNEIAMALVGLCSDGSENAHGAGAVEKNPMLPPNLRLCAEYIEDMTDLFAPGELNGIFLNFSDPWPKARQEKRRLTSPRYLDGYEKSLAKGGFLRFKTDNAEFFEYSRESIERHEGFEVTGLTRDLHSSEYAAENIMTEYERRFTNLRKKINYIEATRVFSHRISRL